MQHTDELMERMGGAIATRLKEKDK